VRADPRSSGGPRQPDETGIRLEQDAAIIELRGGDGEQVGKVGCIPWHRSRAGELHRVAHRTAGIGIHCSRAREFRQRRKPIDGEAADHDGRRIR